MIVGLIYFSFVIQYIEYEKNLIQARNLKYYSSFAAASLLFLLNTSSHLETS